MAYIKRSPIWPDPRVKPPFRGSRVNFSHPLGRGLFGGWLFNEGAGVPQDIVRVTPGIPGGSVSWKASPRGSVYSFDGTSGLLVGPDYAEFNNVAAFTVAALVQLNSLSADDCVFSKDTGVLFIHRIVLAVSEVGIGGTDDVLIVIGNGGNTLGYTQSNLLTTNVLQHWCAVYDGSGAASADKLKFYFNGVPITLTFIGTIPATTDPMAGAGVQMGHENATTNSDATYLHGGIGQALFYNRPLSPQEVAWLNAEPYAMFTPVIRRRYFVPSAAAGRPEFFTTRLLPSVGAGPTFGEVNL